MLSVCYETPFTCQCEKENKNASGFQVLHFCWSFSSDIMAVKGLTGSTVFNTFNRLQILEDAQLFVSFFLQFLSQELALLQHSELWGGDNSRVGWGQAYVKKKKW